MYSNISCWRKDFNKQLLTQSVIFDSLCYYTQAFLMYTEWLSNVRLRGGDSKINVSIIGIIISCEKELCVTFWLSESSTQEV